MKSFIAALVIAIAMVITGLTEVLAQQRSALERPKIGLVLAGGGAKGAAHVGVIKVLEELGVPIDYIAGTSMGAIVGGLYASGLSSDELATAIISIDWNDIFDDKPARANRDFRRKLDDEGFLIRYKLGFKDGSFQFPRGVINGQKLELVLRDFSKKAIRINNFDKLPIPFRAVATDIETGETVILGSGDLANAMRASMAVSGVFPPVENNGRLLVDGGLANNVPMDVARKMGADILIVVGFPERLKKRRELNSAVSIVVQSLDLLISQNSRIQLKTLRPQDVYIEPALGDIGAVSFDRAAEAIPIGEQAARDVAEKLENLARPRKALQLGGSPSTAPANEAVIIDFIRIENKSRLSDSLISSRLSQKPGDELDLDKLEQDISSIYGLDYFETVEYQVVIENDKTGIVITATERSTGLDSFRFGLNLESNFDGESKFNVSARYQKEGLNDLGGELFLQAIAGEKLGATAQFLQPLDPATRYYVNSGLSYLARNVFTFENGAKVAEFRISEAIAILSAARQLGRWGALSVGLNHGYGWKDVNVGPSTLQDDDFGIGAVFSRFNYDTFDQLEFPKSGTKGIAEFRRSTKALGGEDDFNKVTAQLRTARTWDRNTVLVSGNAGFTFDGDSSAQDLFALGGLFNLSGFPSDELTGQNFASSTLIYYRNIGAQEGLLNVPLYLGASLEAGNVWDDRSDMGFDDLIVAGSGFLGVDLPIGPVYLAYGHAEGGNDSVYFFLGQTF